MTILDYIGRLFTESRDNQHGPFTYHVQARFILRSLADSPRVIEMVAAQLADLDKQEVCSNPEKARRLLAGLIADANDTERWVRASEDHDLPDEDDATALRAMLAVYAQGRGDPPPGTVSCWDAMLCRLISLADPDQRQRLRPAFASRVAWADAIEDPALLGRLLASIESA